jgi:hypothetical protein
MPIGFAGDGKTPPSTEKPDMRHPQAAFIIAFLFLSGCVTETHKLTGEVIEDHPYEGPTPVDQIENQVRKRIDHMKYESGTELLRSMETIASCRELALRPIAEAMQTADPGMRSYLVYTLSLMGSSQAHALVARQLSDSSPVVRYEAASALLQYKDVSGIPVLIGFLEDNDRRIRFKSFQALSTFTKEDFGYDFGAPEPERTAAVQRWKDWWTSRRSEIVYQ